MLKTMDLRDRRKPLNVYGPPGLTEVLGWAQRAFGRTRYPLNLIELEPFEELQRDGYLIAAFNVRHRGRAYGYALVEDERPGRFDPGLAAELGVAPGPDFGRLQRGEAVDGVTPEQVMGAARAGRKIVLSGDTAPAEALALTAHGADLLIHEATFTDEERDRAAETGHSTAAQAARIAAEADVGMLALTHVSTRYGGGEVRDEARAIFANTVVPRDFDTITIPFPERGEPELVRWDPEQVPA
jgi:ribonuclease Z